MHLQRNDATIRWEDSKTGGKRIVRQIQDGKNSACAIRNIKGGAPPRKRKTLRFARSGEPLYGYAIVGEKTGERIIMYGYLLPYPILIYICIELFDEMQSAVVQRIYTVDRLLLTTSLISTLRCHSDRYIKDSYPTQKIKNKIEIGRKMIG